MNENIRPSAKEEDVIDLLRVLKVFRKCWAMLIVAGLLFGAAGFAVTKYLMTPKYEASVKMIVNTTKYDENGMIINSSNDNNNLAKNLVDTYGVVIKSSSMLNEVINNMGLDMSTGELEKCISVSAVDDTQVFKISVVTDDVEKSKSIVRAITNVAPARILEAVEAGSCKVVSDVDYSNSPVSPDVKKNTAMAAILGIILAFAVAVIRELQFNYISSSDELVGATGLPCLGVIPTK